MQFKYILLTVSNWGKGFPNLTWFFRWNKLNWEVIKLHVMCTTGQNDELVNRKEKKALHQQIKRTKLNWQSTFRHSLHYLMAIGHSAGSFTLLLLHSVSVLLFSIYKGDGWVYKRIWLWIDFCFASWLCQLQGAPSWRLWLFYPDQLVKIHRKTWKSSAMKQKTMP